MSQALRLRAQDHGRSDLPILIILTLLALRQNNEMVLPNPSQNITAVVLILRQPELAFLAYDVEDVALHVREVGVAGFAARLVDAEFEKAGADEEDGRPRWAGSGLDS